MANVIQQLNKSTLIIAYNKMLAALLYGEFKEMFPNNGEQRITAAPLESGLGGNRTRVQKPIPCTSTIIVRSFSFPLPHGNEHPCRFSSFILRLTAQSFAVIVSHMFDTGFPTCECIRSGMQHLGCS